MIMVITSSVTAVAVVVAVASATVTSAVTSPKRPVETVVDAVAVADHHVPADIWG